MATKVIMPKQGLQMKEGTIIKWLISEGESVVEGKPLFVMETDKLTIEIDALYSGTLLKIVSEEGETVPITETIAIIGELGEDISSFISNVPQIEVEKINVVGQEIAEVAFLDQKPSDRIFITPRAKTKAKEKEINYSKVLGSGPDGLIIEKDIIAYEKVALVNKIRVTPVAEKIMQENNIQLSEVNGTGINGKIMKEDVRKFLDDKAGTTLAGVDISSRQSRVVPCKGMRKIISDRMMESLHTMAQANHRMKVDMSETIRLREQFKNAGIKISFNDILTKVVSKALIEHPYMNSSMVEEGILLKGFVNMGLAVSVSNGLIVPNIKDADQLSLSEIAAASSDLIQKTLNGKLSSDEYTGGTFTISNLGMFEIDEFTAIVNPPECGILGVGKIENTPVVEGETIVIKPIMTLSLTYDHRIIDGSAAAQFLQRIKQLLMYPYFLL